MENSSENERVEVVDSATLFAVKLSAPRLYAEAVDVCRPEVSLETDTPATIEKVATMVLGLRDVGDASRFLQGGLLAKLQQNDAYRRARRDLTWYEFCTQVVGLSPRTVLYLTTIYQRATALGLTPERLAEVGWTKAREFLMVAKEDDIESWIAKAKVLTAAELRQQIEDQRVTGESSAEIVSSPKARVMVMVEADEKALIESAIDFAARLRSDPNRPVGRGTALALIAVEWSANHIADRDQALEWHLRNLESVYGVTLTVTGGESDG